jgi:hypothetical protein
LVILVGAGVIWFGLEVEVGGFIGGIFMGSDAAAFGTGATNPMMAARRRHGVKQMQGLPFLRLCVSTADLGNRQHAWVVRMFTREGVYVLHGASRLSIQ